MKHLFYSLLITFLLAVFAEFVRPGFVTIFFDARWLFLALVVSGIAAVSGRAQPD